MCELHAHLQFVSQHTFFYVTTEIDNYVTKALPFKIQDSGCIGNALYCKNIFVTVTTLRTIIG